MEIIEMTLKIITIMNNCGIGNISKNIIKTKDKCCQILLTVLINVQY